MNIFKRIREIIEELIPFIKKEPRPSYIINFKDIEPELTKINDKLKTERKKAIEQVKQNGFIKLSLNQESLINKKSKILNIANSEKDYVELQKLIHHIEMLETARLLQSDNSFEINKIDEKLIKTLKKEIQSIEYLNETCSELKKKYDLKEVNRKKEIIANSDLRETALQFSLIAIHNQREEERLEQERIEKEKILNEQYKLLLENATSLLNDKEFDRARSELKKALIIKPNRINEIQKLTKTISEKQKDFEKRRIEFKQLFEKAENEFHNDKLKKSIELFTQAQQFDIDNYRCRRRISDAHNKIERIKQREAERKRIEQEEKERREKYKEDAKKILQIFEHNGIRQLYHFTDSRNKNSIIQNGGLFSWWYSEQNNIPVSSHGGDSQSRNLDRRYGLENYVRMTYNSNNPMSYIATKEGRIQSLEWLTIDTKVATLRNTIFSDMNATKTGFKKGKDANFLKKHVQFDVVKWRSQWNPTTNEKSHYYQAEVMVKEHVPLEYITNL